MAAWVALVPAVVWAASRPNILVVFTDDHGYADLSCQGQVADIRTPHIDALAGRGIRMTDGYVTAPQCTPSRAGLITGRYQQRFGLDDNGKTPMRLGEVTLADRLSGAGYVTGMVGKWHLDLDINSRAWMAEHLPEAGPGPQTLQRVPLDTRHNFYPHRRGFQETFNGTWKRYWATYDLDGEDLAPGGERVADDRFRIDVQTEAALAFLKRHHEEPFFLYVSYFAPHVPLEATETYLARFPGDMPERRRYALAMLSAVDDGVGRIHQNLVNHGIADNTLVFFIGDNGAPLKIDKQDRPISFQGGAWDGSLNDPWVGEKGMLSEGGIRVPFIVSWPAVLSRGKVSTLPVISLDVAATSLAAAGLPMDPVLDGIDLVPVLSGRSAAPDSRPLFWRFWNQAAVRKGNWKYLKAGNVGEYLFDLSSPEHETRNRIEEFPDVARSLRADLADWASDLENPGVPKGPPNSQESGWFRHYFGLSVHGSSSKN